ncbi:MAG: transglutaminase family protein [Rhodocyclaceae bacterium]|nr:transglutaminase family protein [Rhodocyclaceae bacterium]MBX3670038.1 transglutaminase family protein [Rhodocyclaceae bacterium]
MQNQLPDELAPFDAAVRAHDAALRAKGLDIWVGSEPTFTNRHSTMPEWMSAALGEDKQERAERLAALLARRTPGAVLLRSVGRCYPGEKVPRWSYGVLRERDGSMLWDGPPDPLMLDEVPPTPDLAALVEAFMTAAAAAGLYATPVTDCADDEMRVLLSEQTVARRPPPAEALLRPSIHSYCSPDGAVPDELAAAGHFLFQFGLETCREVPVARVELPDLRTPARLRALLPMLADAAQAAQLKALVLAGYAPPVDARLAWTTVTPDPAVIEVNMAPFGSVSAMLVATRRLYDSAASMGLDPFRLWFNGDVADSGGAGQITLGGPSALESPFLKAPKLLPRLVRYVNRHPSLSYLFAHDYIGACGQSARADERNREHVDELELALELITREDDAEPEQIWRSLSPFLADIAGNTHRAEINIEKLWNPYLPGRGCLGLVEFRALRMSKSAEQLAALAALFRSVAARLALREFDEPLAYWGAELHDRYALPFFLQRDLQSVFDDLAAAGVGLDGPLRDMLVEDQFRVYGHVEIGGVQLVIRRALEFWPLVGDAASQESGTSRLVDSSNARLELCLRPLPGADAAELAAWRVAAHGVALPMQSGSDASGPARVFGLRYRRYQPSLGLHPSLPAHGPIELTLWHPVSGKALAISLHEWRTDNLPYDGLPKGHGDAGERRAARVLGVESAAPERLRVPPRAAMSRCCLDLRWL